MIAYASRTGTRRNLDALRAADWRLLVSAAGVHRHEGFPYALDNGAWTAHQKNIPFDEKRFIDLVDKLGANADWIVAPDIVSKRHESLRLTELWLPRLDRFPLTLVAVQDGMKAGDVEPWLGKKVGVFLGGTTEYKLNSMAMWGDLCLRVGCYFHVARVNSAKRIRSAALCGANSFDGSSASRYSKNVSMLDSARRNSNVILMFGGKNAAKEDRWNV